MADGYLSLIGSTNLDLESTVEITAADWRGGRWGTGAWNRFARWLTLVL
ncbi:MAG TPA: hypothetical protein VE685_04335 [Thermoanaerobaculia bacterium]|nr:hypothetical protein [Thermoanaerobaculia bacterium]